MRRRLAVALAAAVLVLTAFLLLEQRRSGQAEEAARDEAARTLLPPGRELRRVRLQRAGEAALVLERARGGRWRALLGAPGSRVLPADAATAEALARALAGLRVARWLDASGADRTASPEDCGLAPPLASLVLLDDLGFERRLDLGHRAEGEALVYVQVDGRLGAADVAILSAAGREVEDFLGRELLDLPWGSLRALEITRPPRDGASAEVSIVREDAGGFMVEAPKGSRPRPGAAAWLGGLASRLERLEASGFGSLAPTADELAALGLAPPRIRLVVTGASGPAYTLTIGNSPDASDDGGATWARVGEGPVARIPTALVLDLLRADRDFTATPP